MKSRLARVAMASVVLGLILAWGYGLSSGTAEAATTVTVLPGEGLSFTQIDYTYEGAQTLNSSNGRMDVDIAALEASTGMSSGYLNVESSVGWIVQNLPAFTSFPDAFISSTFDIGVANGTNAVSLDAFVEFSSDPVTSFAGGAPSAFAVGDFEVNAQGFGEDEVAPGPPPAPPAGVISFNAFGIIDFAIQPAHPSLETEVNQCFPAAVSTSLQWLEDTQGINVPHDNIPGLNGNPANSLVGQLDKTMGRLPGQTTGAKQGLDGKLEYLADNGLGNLIVKHQGLLGGGDETDDGPDAEPGTAADDVTSKGQGTKVTIDFIISELKKGEDVELGFLFTDSKKGGHFVEVVAAGKILGTPWVLHKSDAAQGNNSKGTKDGEDLSFSTLKDDGSGQLSLIYQAREANLALVITQSKPPVGGTVDLFGQAESPADASGSASPRDYTAPIAAAVAGVLALAAGGWYLRRRVR